MCKSLPFISSIRFSRSLNDKPMAKFPFGYESLITSLVFGRLSLADESLANG
jgi:hypothetical protein